MQDSRDTKNFWQEAIYVKKLQFYTKLFLSVHLQNASVLDIEHFKCMHSYAWYWSVNASIAKHYLQ